MSNFQAVYYRDGAGYEPVREFIDALAEEAQAAIKKQVGRLNLLSETMPHLPFPHSSQVRGELRELRCHYGRDHYRILYRRSGQLLVLLHIFAKRSAKVGERHRGCAAALGGLQGAHGRAETPTAARGRPRCALTYEPIMVRSSANMGV